MRLFVRFLAAALVIFGGVFAYVMFDVHRFSLQPGGAKADAAIVLGAAVWGEEPSPVFRARIDHGLQLLRDGKVKTVIFTGAVPAGETVPEALVALRYAQRQGVSLDDVLVETRSHNTYQRLHFAQNAAQEHGLGSFLIVSDPYHLRRALSLSSNLGMKAQASPVPGSFANSWALLIDEAWRNLVYHARNLISAESAAEHYLAIDSH